MSWSPDGRKITYQDGIGASSSGYDDIFVVEVETGFRQNLTNDGGGNIGLLDYNPAWSPDGSTILYSSPRYNGVCTSLYAMNPDGTNRRLLSGNHCPAYSPSWAPDGTKIVFLQLNGEFVESELRIANSDGTNVRIFDGGYPDLKNRDYPRWSPDGNKIIFNLFDYPASDDIEIYVKNVDGAGYAQLTNTIGGRNYRPSWQPLAPALTTNPIEDPQFFVRQHYLDFLNREPDGPGLAHWVGEITACDDSSRRQPGESLAVCIERKRTNTSAAFFLSPEFQYTGYFVYRLYKGSLLQNVQNGAGRPPTYQEFLRDAAQVAQSIIQPINSRLQLLNRTRKPLPKNSLAGQSSAAFTTRSQTLITSSVYFRPPASVSVRKKSRCWSRV